MGDPQWGFAINDATMRKRYFDDKGVFSETWYKIDGGILKKGDILSSKGPKNCSAKAKKWRRKFLCWEKASTHLHTRLQSEQ